MMKPMVAMTALSLLVALGAPTGTSAQAGVPVIPREVAGRWVSVGCETTQGPEGPRYVMRDLRLTESTWAVDLTVYGDANCAEPTLVVRVEGPYLLGQASTTVPGATDALFVEAEAQVTPRSAAAVEMLNGAPAGTCGAVRWARDDRQRLRPMGCALLGIGSPAAEYDLVKRDGDRLFLGARPSANNDLNAPERRPTALNAPLEPGAATQ